ncbi:hypothetical protein DPMN_092271 [Dreissena polymorpha]|uniref:Uncharacterized protein n=2 Tax=Dreissena polymorpha TaxID=45954 RepID=A0A9D4L3B5_DREPO|nr:hypothetical protein DPMN_092271 [Dreissena polymorpha]
MCNLTCKKASMLVCGGFIILMFTLYALFFNHGAPEDIMVANKGSQVNPKFKHYHDRDPHKMNELEKEVAEEERRAAQHWDEFIAKNDFVNIGEIYDNCDEKDRVMIGRTIMLPTVHWAGLKGVKSRTFINITLHEELTGGKFFLEVKYNGKDLFARNWELCTLDEDYDDRVVYCPFLAQDYSFVKDRDIPVYLPKGRYQTKGWITDVNDEIVACGFSDFTL